MALPLSGIKVLDFSQILAGPLTSMLLADQGAEVIKLEPPEGDYYRNANPKFPDAPGMTYDFLPYNRNKRSIVVDVTKPLGVAIAHRLLQWADVAVVNMRIPARQRLSVTYEDAAALNPRLIYVSVTGYGESGPDRDLPAADINIQPRVGDLAGRRLPGGAMPGPTRLSHFDTATSMLGAYAIMLALWERERTGLGQRIETNLLHSALAMQMGQMTRLAANTSEGRPMIGQFAGEIYVCSDGRYIFAPIGGRRWNSVRDGMGLSDLDKDERFNTPEKREARAEDLRKILAGRFLTRPAEEWEADLKAAGSDATVFRDMTEVYSDPQVTANKMIVEYDQPGIGAVTLVNVPFTLSRTADEERLRRPVPYKGEHTLEVLQELGYSAQEIDAFRKAKAVE